MERAPPTYTPPINRPAFFTGFERVKFEVDATDATYLKAIFDFGVTLRTLTWIGENMNQHGLFDQIEVREAATTHIKAWIDFGKELVILEHKLRQQTRLCTLDAATAELMRKHEEISKMTAVYNAKGEVEVKAEEKMEV